jgi:putative membrane protein
MITLRNTFSAATAALVVSSVGLAACEKAANMGSTPPATDDSGSAAGGSTVPALPALGGPMFSPDLVYRMGEYDLFAINEGKIALARSQNASVKSFASAAIEARTKSMTALNAAIDASNQTISLPDTLPNDLLGKVSALQDVDAAKFDQAYLADQVASLQAAVNALKTFAKHGDAAAFKSYANASVSGVESSLAAAQTLQTSLK